MSKIKFLSLIVALFALVSCDIYSGWDDPDNPYEQYDGRMIDRIRIDQAGLGSNFIYYDYDRRGRIIAIDDTFTNSIEEYAYGKDQYGDDMISLRSSKGEDRDIILDWSGFAEQEYSYTKGNLLTRMSEYNYIGGDLRDIYIEEYYNDGSLYSQEEYEFDYDHYGSLEEISRTYDEDDYYEDILISFTRFSTLENYYNVDILSILGLYIDNDFASRIGRTGNRSRYLPTEAVLSIRRNGRYDKDVIYRINYIANNGIITAIEMVSSAGLDRVFYISYI